MQKIERVGIVLLLLIATGFGQAFLSDPNALDDGRNQPYTQVVFGLFYLMVFLLLVKHRTAAFQLVKRERWTAILCLWTLASVAWSVDPGESLRRSLALAGTSLAGLYLGLKYEPRDQLKMMSFVMGLGAVASILVVIALPSYGIQPSGWQGIYNLKNSLGRMMALGAFCFALLALSERRRRVVRIAMFLLCCALLVMSRSATAVVVTMLVLALLPMRRLLYLNSRKLLAVAALAVPVVFAGIFWFVESSDQLLEGLGRTSSLTGRIPLWQLVVKEIAVRPIRGWGYTAFWDSWEGQRVSDTVAWDTAVPHSHNGFLEIWLGLGLIGLVLLLVSLSRNFILAVRAARSHRDVEYAWPLLMLIFTVLYNLTEDSFLGVNSMPWMAFGAVTFWLARPTQQESVEEETQPEVEPVYSA